MTTRISPILIARELCERSRQLRMEGVIARANAECELAETRMANARIQERSKILLRRAPLHPYRGVRVVSEREIDECPGCRSRTRRWRDKLWNDARATWMYCLDPWHDAAPQQPMSEESGE